MPEYNQPDYPRIPADKLRGLDGKRYTAHEDLLAAANAALAIQRPLLLTGEAGCGKTDFAHAVAAAFEDDPEDLERCYVRSDSRARDLLYEYDALRRYGDANLGEGDARAKAQDPRNYIELKPLGRALMSVRSKRPRVVLIDEIDKAPRDLPNDLLQELDRGFFEIPEIADVDNVSGEVDVESPRSYRFRMVSPTSAVRPFIIITSNVERQLPDPFLRRCVFFHIPFPDDDVLKKILKDRFEPVDDLVSEAVTVFRALRKVTSVTKPPTTSEMIDWYGALISVFEIESAKTSLKALVSKLDPERPRRLPWGEVPALSCLVKLREDLERLGALSA